MKVDSADATVDDALVAFSNSFQSTSSLEIPKSKDCILAKSWFEFLDDCQAARQVIGAPPAWLRSRFEWGWSPWPLTWSRAASSEKLDCGALAAISSHLMRRRGFGVFQAQLVLRYSALKCESWAAIWKEANWIIDDFVYHEVLLVPSCSAYRIWDPTDVVWTSFQREPGSDGEVIAIRHFAGSDLCLKGENTLEAPTLAASGRWIKAQELK